VRSLFDYNPDTGLLLWKIRSHGRRADRAGSRGTSGYIKVETGGKIFLSHRLIWLWNFGYFPENEIDHINGDGSDNRLSNLREATRSCNLFNRKYKGKEEVTGVCKSYRKGERVYIAAICKDGNSTWLHESSDYVEAVAYRLAAEQCLELGSCVKSAAKDYINSYVNQIYKKEI